MDAGTVGSDTALSAYRQLIPADETGITVGAPQWCPVATRPEPAPDDVYQVPLAEQYLPEGSLRLGPASIRAGSAHSKPRATPRPARSIPPAASGSPYDAALVDQGAAPGQDVPLGYDPPPPAPDAAVADASERTTRDQATTAAVDQAAQDRTESLSRIASSVLNQHETVTSRPQVSPNVALAQAVAGLSSHTEAPLPGLQGLAAFADTVQPGDAFQRQLIGAGAAAMNAAMARWVASSKTTSLGWAYAQGVGLGLVNGVVDMAAQTAELGVAPVNSAAHMAADISDEINRRVAAGESIVQAVAEVLLPPFQVIQAFPAANQLAGQALAAAHRGEPERAVALARKSGTAAASVGIAAAQTYMLFEGGVSAARRRLRPAWRDPVPTMESVPPPTMPEKVPPPAPSPVTGTVDPTADPQLPALSTYSKAHPVDPNLQVHDPDYVRVMSNFQREVVQAKAQDFARKQIADPVTGGARELRLKEWFNATEMQSALDDAMAHPNSGFLVQAKIRGVTLADGTTVSIETINQHLGRTKGRIVDYIRLDADGTYTFVENKRWNTIVDSYGRKGVNRSSSLGGQIAREMNVFDFARKRPGAVVDVSGLGLDGNPTSIKVPPQKYRGATPIPYGATVM